MPRATPVAPIAWLTAVLERTGWRRRLPATAYHTAASPAAIRALVFRRAGVPLRGTDDPDEVAYGLALARSPGWTPAFVRETFTWGDTGLFRHLPVAWECAFAGNPALEMSWVHAALAARPKRSGRDSTGVQAVVDRIAGATPPRGWSGREAVWGPVAAAVVALYGERRDHDLVRLLDQVITAVRRDPTLTDPDVAALLTVSAAWQPIGRYPLEHHEPMPARQAALLQHPAAATETVRVFLQHVAREHVGWWVALPSLRPEWMARPDIQAGLAQLVARLHGFRYALNGPLVRFVCTYGPAEAVAAWWVSYFPTDSEGGWARLGLLPDATLDALGFTAHDLSQALVHAETAEARLGVLAALRRVGRADAPVVTEAPTVATLARPYATLEPPVIPEAFAAHHPAVRAWLAADVPGVAEYHAAVRRRRTADETAEDDDRRRLMR